MALIQCPECGASISDKAEQCIHCGYPLRAEKGQEQIFCPCCGKRNDMGACFCSSCGSPLKDAGDIGTSSESYQPKDIMSLIPAGTSEIKPVNRAASPVAEAHVYEPVARCPRCGSTSLSAKKKGFGYGKALAGAVLVGGVGLLAGGMGANKTIVTCLNCGYEYELKN